VYLQDIEDLEMKKAGKESRGFHAEEDINIGEEEEKVFFCYVLRKKNVYFVLDLGLIFRNVSQYRCFEGVKGW
jgi:hypothetical protein